MARIKDPRDLRTELLDEFKKSKSPLTLLELSKQLGIKSDTTEYEVFKQTLDRLCTEGIVKRHARRRYSLVRASMPSYIGTVKYYHNTATVTCTDPSLPTVQIHRHNLGTALDGDLVQVQPHARVTGKKMYAEVTTILERANHTISGTIEFDGSFFYIIPDESRYHVDFMVYEKNLKGAKPGDKVMGRLVRWDNAKTAPQAEVIEVLGKSGNPEVEFAAIMKEFRLPVAFPADVEQAAQHLEVPDAIPPTRIDIRDTTVITIDPVDAKDFDDALSLERVGENLVELGVHIADVSHYVTENSIIDKEALRRGTSTYLVHRVVPMLPEKLSNDICSLVPGKTRFAFSVFMTFTTSGVLQSYRISETAIKSSRRFTYEEAQAIIELHNNSSDANHSDLSKHDWLVVNLYQLSKTLYNHRIKNGGIDFETQEVKFLLDEHLHPTSAVVKTRTDATSLVEECMLAANRVVAEHVESLKKTWRLPEPPPLVYRIHEQPDEAKLADAVSVVRALGFEVPSGKLTPVQINAVLAQVRDKPERAVVNTLLLRSMAKAVYSEFNVGHYGLGFTAYAHFTSPIRRYPDLFVHRALKEYLQSKPTDQRSTFLHERAGLVSDQSTATERAAVEAERASQKLTQAMIARDHLSEAHTGTVTGVTTFGVFVLIDTLMCEGLLHIRDLGDDYYHFDEKRMRLVGRRTRRVLQFGSVLNVVISRVDMDKRMIDLTLQAEQTLHPATNN